MNEQAMNISILTYNVFFNKALSIVPKLLDTYKPDIICLQEVETSQEHLQKLEIDNYKIADFSNSFIKFSKVFGLVTFYNPTHLKLIETSSIDIPRSFIEVLVTIFRGFNNPRTVLKTKFIHLPTNKIVNVYNVHFTHLIASNRTRIRQLQETLSDLDHAYEDASIITGDFNYTYGRKKFEEIIQAHNFAEATNNLTFTARGIHHLLFLKLKSDYILYKNLQLVSNEKIDYTESDHYPIFSRFRI